MRFLRRSALAIVALLYCSGCQRGTAPTIQPPAVRVPADSHPAWSPDGRFLAYSHAQQPDGDTLLTGLYLIDLFSGVRRRLFTGNALTPDWFSDSRRIEFTAGNILSTTIDGDPP